MSTSYLDTTSTEQYDIIVFDAQGNEVAYATRPNVAKEHVMEEVENRTRSTVYQRDGLTARLVKVTLTRSYELAD